ncbi:hypothetical protein Cgig2_024613 [Carnegiea gigantea]|uniref:Uncharacterized protein n=1 Tax=Carnegiea gigantea TaxID=171969 RepID=A0A9Q1QE83_9CARY|nr:hypothetical protein Cgig2_024613 [Carnegiea gigantea]
MSSTNQVDTDPKKFALPVDAENKVKISTLFSFAKPHMRAFHLSWVQFFACFVSTFAAPPLLPIIRDNLNLSATDIGNAGIAAVSGAVFARVAMGTACDLFGPRLASASLTLLTAPAVYLSAIANNRITFFLVRFFTGFSSATFVSTQFWMSSIFSPQTLSAFAVMLFAQDMPDGNFQELHKSGEMHKNKFSKVLFRGIANYRGWITALCYGYCFGVVLAVDNIIAQYFYDRVGSLSASVAVMLVLSVLLQATCGFTFGVIPFMSRRALGGMTGAGGNVGAVITQVIFFKGSPYSEEMGITYMGVMIIACTLPICLIYLPQWGGMFCGPKANYTEEDYYLQEWNSREQQQGFHQISLTFADSSRTERCKKVESAPSETNAPARV